MASFPAGGHSGEAVTHRVDDGHTRSAALSGLAGAVLPLSSLVVFAAVYYFAVELGLGFRFQNTQIGVTWPANAWLIAALLLTPRSRWWIVLAAMGLAHAVAMAPVVPAWRWSWQIGGNWAFALTTAVVMQRVAGVPLNFGSRRQVLAFTGIALTLPGLFAPTTPGFVRSVFGLETLNDPPLALLRIALSNATAILLVTPTILLWTQYGARRLQSVPARKVLESVAIFSLLFAVGFVAFGTGPEIARMPSLLLWLVPPMLWAAVRLGPEGAATSLFCVGALSVWGTSQQLGPFVLVADEQVLSLQLFWIVIGPPIMLLAAAIREREEVEAALQAQRTQLAHVTRVATVGELSGALAHELNQPLAAILANARAGLHVLARDPANAPKLQEILADIAQEDQQATSVITRVRTFLKQGPPQDATVAIETVVRDALALSRSTITDWRVELDTDIAPDLPPVRGDAVQLLQVAVNLIVNSCEAMQTTPPEDRRLRVAVAPIQGQQVEVLVSDSGTGVAAGNEERVFEPFFTTKSNGLGLGLAICRSIVASYGGRLWCENNADRGATFHLVLHAVT